MGKGPGPSTGTGANYKFQWYLEITQINPLVQTLGRQKLIQDRKLRVLPCGSAGVKLLLRLLLCFFIKVDHADLVLFEMIVTAGVPAG